MTEIFPNEGLDYLLSILPKGGTTPATLYLGLFTSQTASTVPAATDTLATITEAAYPGYARVEIAAADWGTVGTKTIWGETTARGTTATQQSFPAATGADSTPINGFFIATAATGGIALFYSNFDDTTAIASLALGDIIRVTPTFGFLG